MKEFWRKRGGWILLLALVLSGVTIGSSYLLTGNANPFANLLGILGTPVRDAGAVAGNWIEQRYADAFEREELREEIDRLRRELSAMEQKAQQGEAALRENERLRTLLGLREARRDFVLESATVTAYTASNWESSFLISKGAAHGVAANQCVLDEAGYLVGIVTEVGYNWATVSTIADASTDLGGLVSRTDSAAILEGDFALMQEDKLKLTYLPENTDLMAGDLVLTSGRGGIFPAGLTVGVIESLHTAPTGTTRYAVVVPRARLSEVKQVFLIKEFDIVE